MRVTAQLRGGDVAIEKLLEAGLLSEQPGPDLRMETVGADDDVEALAVAVGARDDDAVPVFGERGERDPEVRGYAVAGAEQRGGQIGTRDAEETPVQQVPHGGEAGRGLGTAVAVDESQPFHRVPVRPQFRHDAHALGDLVPDSPKVDEVSAAAQTVRFLEQHRLVTVLLEPKGERRAADARSVDRYSHGSPLFLLRPPAANMASIGSATCSTSSFGSTR